ncbi:MAG: glycosyltransferase family 2 protein, partial [Pseudomonadota bacterium]|nr:glycosyltransferase family 2 protein [Pseudomonadota bacterium]
MPRVSVLMPAYNSEKYVAQAIESILNQTFTDFEFIIINDGSTDDTPKIVREYAARDPRIKFIDNAQNQGLIAVLNQGLDLCTGEYIARMDSDDISHPERFQLQVEYLDANPNVGVIGAWARLFGARDGVYKYKPVVRLLDALIYGANVAHPAAMIRTSVLRNNKIYYNPKYPHAEDYGFWVSIARV